MALPIRSRWSCARAAGSDGAPRHGGASPCARVQRDHEQHRARRRQCRPRRMGDAERGRDRNTCTTCASAAIMRVNHRPIGQGDAHGRASGSAGGGPSGGQIVGGARRSGKLQWRCRPRWAGRQSTGCPRGRPRDRLQRDRRSRQVHPLQGVREDHTPRIGNHRAGLRVRHFANRDVFDVRAADAPEPQHRAMIDASPVVELDDRGASGDVGGQVRPGSIGGVGTIDVLNDGAGGVLVVGTERERHAPQDADAADLLGRRCCHLRAGNGAIVDEHDCAGATRNRSREPGEDLIASLQGTRGRDGRGARWRFATV